MHSDLGTRGGGGLALQGAIAGWPGEEAPCNPKDMDLGLGHLGGGSGHRDGLELASPHWGHTGDGGVQTTAQGWRGPELPPAPAGGGGCLSTAWT